MTLSKLHSELAKELRSFKSIINTNEVSKNANNFIKLKINKMEKINNNIWDLVLKYEPNYYKEDKEK